MKKLKWSNLTPNERAELQSVINSPERNGTWEPNSDWLGFMILALPASIAAGIAMKSAGFDLPVVRQLLNLREMGAPSLIVSGLFKLLYIAPFVLPVWLAVFLIRNWKRRGSAVTSFATVRVLGPKLKLVRHEDVSRVNHWIMESPKHSCRVLELFDRDQAKLTFYTTGNLANLAIAAINQNRSEPVPVTSEIK